jgi:hypothetical protein
MEAANLQYVTHLDDPVTMYKEKENIPMTILNLVISLQNHITIL